ncbi:hypothetical protein TanjilG_27080 [Lupinus angustifolius]|uniref:Protein kinase domain-containing protein n=1 Tax=Lupinus angustifolius TaxID=3871 RepID=A0A4P1QVT9_LUPAN|nr:hypothetical protein TanjilG_27080 [Lupinus angustifolius]
MKDPSCYVDKWFEIECRYYTPYLKSLNLEVRDIGFDYIIEIMNPVFYWNCHGKTNTSVIDLKGSPFRYSQYGNKFVAYGCNKLAFLQSDGSTIGGCVSICDHNDKSFYGIGSSVMSCCKASLPSHLSEYNVTLSDMNNESVVDENGWYSQNNHSHSKKWAIEGVSSSLGSVILLFGLWWSYKALRKRVIKKRKEKFFKRNGGLLLQQRLSTEEVSVHKIFFTLKDIERATDKFNANRVLGKGGQGTVYKGMLVDGKIVAVKKFKVQGKVEEFINEFAVLSQINHRNVVKLLGCCLETKIPLLVYEFIPNGNLFEYLHVENEDLPVTWDIRLRIAVEIAGALFYLHSIASQPIYHRDIKSTNILLDEKYRAKVADFGTSRVVSIEATHLTTVVQGTFGYLDPEYFHTSQFTDKSDVYSFGVVLAELITGKRPISVLSSEEARNLASYFVLSMEENQLFEIIDKRVAKESDKEQINAVANLAYACLELNGRKRPTMKEVTLELERIQGGDRRFNAKQNYEEIELARTHEYQHFDGYSMPNTLPIIHTEIVSSEVMPILKSDS